MYYTITLNPAIDMLTKVENFELGKLNRTGESKYVVGGKGIRAKHSALLPDLQGITSKRN